MGELVFVLVIPYHFFSPHLALCEKYRHLIIFYLYCGVFRLLYVDKLRK